MSYIFLDESGDLGFDERKKSSHYFIITILVNTDKKRIEKIIKKIHHSLRKKVKKLSGGILHCFKEKPITRKRLLKLLLKTDSLVMVICLNKDKVHVKLHDEKHILYNYVTNILLDRILTKKLVPIGGKITLIVSKRETNKFLNINFSNYLKRQIQSKHRLDLDILIKKPAEEKALQATDFVSWAIFNKYENNEKEYYNLIREMIREENLLFP